MQLDKAFNTKPVFCFFIGSQNLDCQKGDVYFLHMLQLYVYILCSMEIGIFNDDLQLQDRFIYAISSVCFSVKKQLVGNSFNHNEKETRLNLV